MRTTQVVAVLAFAALGAVASPAVAAGPKAPAGAPTLQAEGLELLQAGRPGEALQKLEAAYALSPTPPTAFAMGRAHQQLGNFVQALEFYERFLREAKNLPPHARADAESRREAIRAQLAYLSLSGPTGGKVLIDGREVGTLPMTEPVAVVAGTHEVGLRKDGARGRAQTVDSRPGTTTTLTLAMPEPEPAAREAPALPPLPPEIEIEPAPRVVAAVERERAFEWTTPAAWTGAALGATGLALGVFYQARAGSEYERFNAITDASTTADRLCHKPAPLSGGPQCQSALEAGDRAQRRALVGFVLGGALAVTSGVLFYLNAERGEPARQAAWLCGPAAGPGVGCGGRF